MKREDSCFTSCVICNFKGEGHTDQVTGTVPVDVFFARYEDCVSSGAFLHFNEEDRQRAGRLKNEDERNTLLMCYTLLRHILAVRIHNVPENISYVYGDDGKPGLKENSYYFNISHSGKAFAFAVSQEAEVGIDLEDSGKKIDFDPVVRRFFNSGEAEYVYGSGEGAKERFYLLWTRKEALLKAVGSGITGNFSKLQVHMPENMMRRDIFPDPYKTAVHDHYFIHSCMMDRFFLSLATTAMVKPELHRIDGRNAGQYILKSK
jgi:phosphopantetheinyl transferase